MPSTDVLEPPTVPSGGGPADPVDADDDDGGGPDPAPFGLTRLRVVALVAAVAFLGGAAGWALAQPRPPGAGSADVGFLHDMVAHHSQAVQLSTLVARPEVGADPGVVLQAQAIALSQTTEIGLMVGRLRAWDRPDQGGDTVMGWMGEPVPVAEMPGLASPDDVARLRDATGAAADELFLRLMVVHHQGGVAMAEAALERAGDDDVLRLAATIAAAQRSEITELVQLGQRIGIDVPVPEGPVIEGHDH